MAVRLDKFLADYGFGTRSEVKKLISKGKIKVDGITIKKAESKVNENSIVSIEDIDVVYREFVYYLMNKPAGYLCATKDKSQPVVLDLLEDYRKNLAIVGRLDKDSEGALLLTNDGKLNHFLLAPSNKVAKKYYVKLDSVLPENAKEILENPIKFKDFETKGSIFQQIDDCSAYLTIWEGKHHQVKRMFERIGCSVKYLKRVEFAGLNVDDLPIGQYRELTSQELEMLLQYKK
ncbi:MAG TPA: pseudouridine synthase [Erysipelotrichaceae bacterium]|nr:rRNA pseudouridine synthase [Erysipelotrichia bacterium]HPX32467.1 pseudouridine synthase [Erysipelotrichaceae bacterium]HQA85164.1 pseudouridine synthase [Erysipelotrichaceae bacterium]